jgi:hypothetical protein
MKTHADDPILIEMHAIKDAVSAEFGHDIDALFAHLKALEAGILTSRNGPTAPAKLKRRTTRRIQAKRKVMI